MRTQRCVLILAAAAFLVFLFSAAVPAQPLQFGISPAELELVPTPGGTATGVLVVFNRSSSRLRFSVKLEDMYIRPSGEMNLLKSGSLESSVAKLTRVLPSEFDLDPNHQMPVRVSVTVPPDARGARYGAIVVSPAPVLQTPAGTRGTVSIMVPKVVAKLLVPIRGTEVVGGAIVNMLAAPKPGGKGADIKVVFRNSGNVHARTTGDVFVLDASGQQVGKVRLPEALVLPSSIREFRLSWDAKPLEPGTYTVRAVMDYGAAVLVSGEVGFTYRKP